MFDWKTILLFFLTWLMMFFFAGIEMAFYSANRLTIELRKKQGGLNGQLVSKFVESPAAFLGSTLIGFSIFLTFFILQISTVMKPVWNYLHVASATIHLVAEIFLATFVVLIFAEFIPRAIFRARSNVLLHGLARVTDFFYRLFYPIADLLIRLSEWMLKYVFNVRIDKHKESFTRNELKNLFRPQGPDERQDRSTQLLENAQELPKIRIRQCLVPRKEIIGVEATVPMDEVRRRFIETKLSKLVVYDKNIDHITGYVHQLDLFKKPANLQSILLPIPAVPESMSASDLITKFSSERKSIAWVVDEFGGTAGIITMEDVLEELFGEIQDEYDTEEFTGIHFPPTAFQ